MGDIFVRFQPGSCTFLLKLDQNEGHHLILLDLRKLFTLLESNCGIQNFSGQALDSASPFHFSLCRILIVLDTFEINKTFLW